LQCKSHTGNNASWKPCTRQRHSTTHYINPVLYQVNFSSEGFKHNCHQLCLHCDTRPLWRHNRLKQSPQMVWWWHTNRAHKETRRHFGCPASFQVRPSFARFRFSPSLTCNHHELENKIKGKIDDFSCSVLFTSFLFF